MRCHSDRKSILGADIQNDVKHVYVNKYNIVLRSITIFFTSALFTSLDVRFSKSYRKINIDIGSE